MARLIITTMGRLWRSGIDADEIPVSAGEPSSLGSIRPIRRRTMSRRPATLCRYQPDIRFRVSTRLRPIGLADRVVTGQTRYRTTWTRTLPRWRYNARALSLYRKEAFWLMRMDAMAWYRACLYYMP